MTQVEQLFRILFIFIFFSTISISVYFRRKARRSGEAISRRSEGRPALLLRLILAILLYLPFFAYMLNPAWMAWSSLPLPGWLRWLGGALGLAMLPVVYWVFSSLDRNISETFLTKESHELVTHGPYRWVRHPLYSVATVEFISLGLLAANWLMLLMAILAIIALSLLVIPREEAELVNKFGEQYREYMRRSGRLIPRLG